MGRCKDVYLMKGRTAISGDLFGSPVSDLVPKSTRDSNLQSLTELRVVIQQQLATLMVKEGKKTLISTQPLKH